MYLSVYVAGSEEADDVLSAEVQDGPFKVCGVPSCPEELAQDEQTQRTHGHTQTRTWSPQPMLIMSIQCLVKVTGGNLINFMSR